MWQSNYQYYASLSTPDGDHIAEARLKVDWVPAVRWAEFERCQKSDTVSAVPAAPVIEPIWEPETTPPFISGAVVHHGEERGAGASFPLSYFSAAISEASSQLLSSGKLSAGQEFAYQIYALAEKQPRCPADPGIDVIALDEPLPIEVADLSSLLAGVETGTGINRGEETASQPVVTDVMPVFVPRSVLDEATTLGQATRDVETGGILVGKLLRDGNGTLFSRVTAQIPAEHTRATRESLRFTPATWVSVDAAIRLRARDEIPLGWWHSHPFFCHQCPSVRRAVCPLSVPMFSAADRALHREIFQKPWSIGLLLSFLGQKQPSYDLYAWNQGQIDAVNFFILPDKGSNNGECP
jgi:hypothetical protein